MWFYSMKRFPECPIRKHLLIKPTREQPARTPRRASSPESSFAHSVRQAGSLPTGCDRQGAPSLHKDVAVGEPLSFLRKSGHCSHVTEEGRL